MKCRGALVGTEFRVAKQAGQSESLLLKPLLEARGY